MDTNLHQYIIHQASSLRRWAWRLLLAFVAVITVAFSSVTLAKTQVNSVTLSSSSASPTFGVPPTFTVLVTAASGSARPTGTVNISDGLVTGGIACTISLGNGPTSNVGAGVCIPAASYPVGSRSLIAIYNGDINYNAQISDNFAMTVVPSFTITANAGAGGTVNPGLYTLVRQGSTVTFDFTPTTGFRLQSVTGVVTGCTVISAPLAGGVVRYTISQINANCSISGVFSNLYNIEFIADAGGTVSPRGVQRVAFGTTSTIIVTPNAGFRLVNVNGCGIVFVGGTAITTPTSWTTAPVSADCTVTAFFTALPVFTVTAAAGAGGNISPTSVVVAQGLTTQFTVSAAAGFQIASVSGCAGTRSGNIFTTGPITSACAVTATFSVAALPTFTVTATAGPGGSISPASTNVIQGGTASFTVSGSSGFTIASVSGCGGSLSGNVFSTAAISAACTVSANFSATNTAPSTTRMIEYRHPSLDYYFITSRPNEIALLDITPPFVRTGQSFLVYPSAVAGTHPITRFYFDKVAVGGSRGSHFYTLVDAELIALIALNPSNSTAPKLPFSEGTDSFAYLPLVEGVGGSCAASLVPVLRVFRGNARFPDDPNHRFTTSTAIYNAFVAQGWDGEGVKFCVPG